MQAAGVNDFMQVDRAIDSIISMAAGINDSVDHAIELAELLHKWGPGYHVNLIPYNPIEGSEYQRPYRKSVSCFAPLADQSVKSFLYTTSCKLTIRFTV